MKILNIKVYKDKDGDEYVKFVYCNKIFTAYHPDIMGNWYKMEDDRHVVQTELTENGVNVFSDFLRKIWNKTEIEDTEIDLPRIFFEELRTHCNF